MASADCLSYYRLTSSPTPTQKGKGHSKESNRKSDGKPSKSGGKGWKKPHDAQAKVGERATSSQTTRPSGCFICDGPHRARDCPKKEKLNALRAEDGEDIGGGRQVFQVRCLHPKAFPLQEGGEGNNHNTIDHQHPTRPTYRPTGILATKKNKPTIRA